MITWDIRQGAPANYSSTLEEVLGNGVLQPAYTTTSFTLSSGANTIVFDGTFTVGWAGIFSGGTITGLHVYYGANLILDAEGYAIELFDFLAGNKASNEAPHLLLYADPRTINGSAQDDIIGGGNKGGYIFGNDGNDYIGGGSGDNIISGGDGMDTLVGDMGEPGYLFYHGVDTVDYSEKTGSVQITLSANQVTTVYVDGVAEDTILEFENANGGQGSDRIIGSDLVNRLVGTAGDDVLDGGFHADTLIGGQGDDTYVVDNVGDIVTEAVGEGIDTVQSSISYALGANVESLTLLGAFAIDGAGNELANTIFGNGANNVLDGGLGADAMFGDLGDDTYVVENIGDTATEKPGEGTDTVNASVSFALGANVENLVLTGTAAIDGTGNELANVITGNAGANLLAGGLGLDSLTGGEGSDSFVFDTKLAADNVDHVFDFAAGLDRIGLDANIFKKVNDGGTLKAKFFADGKAEDGNDYIIFKEKTGALYYDKDGDGGKFGKVKIATLSGAPDIDNGDFFIV